MVVNIFVMCLQTTLQTFKKSDFSVIREHEEFVWLHDRFTENEDYAGIMVCFTVLNNSKRCDYGGNLCCLDSSTPTTAKF